MNNKYNLFLDDVRLPKNVTWVNLPLVNWTIVRNYLEFVKIITENGLPDNVTFDHDLAAEHYNPTMYSDNPNDYNKLYTAGSFKEKTGLECVKWLVEYCMDKNLDFPSYTIHTMNPIGGQNMISYIESYRKSRSF